MNIHEYQTKKLLADLNIPVPRGAVVDSTLSKPVDVQMEEAFQQLASESVWVVKAQIHAGGRGKAGGVKVCKSLEDAKAQSKVMLQKTLVTAQTGKEGKKVHKILIEQGLLIEQEFYVSILCDRSLSQNVFILSQEGGMDIEHVAATTPDKIVKIPIDPILGFQPFHGRKCALALGLGVILKEAAAFFEKLYRFYEKYDCSLLEINPLVLTKDQKLIVLDAKVNCDENALYRQPEIVNMRDVLEEKPQDVEASRYGLAYIALDGNIGCLVNGAGLAMATMDIIQLHGGKPANFLDVGGGASQEKVAQAFELILKDHQVKAILVNIFGGIMKCDVIAQGIIEAAKQVSLKVPLVVRLEGTNVNEGKELLKNSGLSIIAAQSLQEAAQKVVQAANKG